MARLPYVPADISQPADIVDAVRARRGGSLLNLDRTLLHSPALTKGWNAYLGAVRTELNPDTQQLRELAICGVAVMNDAPYEYGHHAPVFMQAGGTAAQAEGLKNWAAALANAALYTPAQLAVMRLTDEMTKQVKVSDATFAAARAVLPSDADMVELVTTIAAYNMVSRFLVALGVDPE